MKWRSRIVLSMLAVLAALSAGCPATGVSCRAGTIACGEGCVDPLNDALNCGACGNACATGQQCAEGSCECTQGAVSCGGACVVTAYDARHCGGCGKPCGQGEVCEGGACKPSCTVGTHVRCESSCVDATSDAMNCGGCGVACEQGQSCRSSRCGYEVVAACYNSGQVFGFSASTLVRGPLSDLGSGPQSLAAYGGTLLCADGSDNRLYQAVASGAGGGFSQVNRANGTGSAPNQVLAAPPYVYVVNSVSGTLQVLKEDAGNPAIALDAGVEGGVVLGTVAELPLGANGFPEGLARVGDALWVPLYGGYGAGPAAEGQAVLKVSIADPEQPVVVGRVDLKGIDLKAFDGGAPVARPWAVAAHRGAIYVALNNLNPDTYRVEGPGLLARIDPGSSQLSVVELGQEHCLNPLWMASVGDFLAVSCGGAVEYDSDYSAARISTAGVVLLDGQDKRIATWSAACPADAGVLLDGGSDCGLMMPGRFAVVGRRIFLGDQNKGRVVVLDATDAGFEEVRGVGNPMATCPTPAFGVNNVSDVLALP